MPPRKKEFTKIENLIIDNFVRIFFVFCSLLITGYCVNFIQNREIKQKQQEIYQKIDSTLITKFQFMVFKFTWEGELRLIETDINKNKAESDNKCKLITEQIEQINKSLDRLLALHTRGKQTCNDSFERANLTNYIHQQFYKRLNLKQL